MSSDNNAESGFVTIGFEYHDAVTQRLRNSGISHARQCEAMAILFQIINHLGWETHECTKNSDGLCEITRTDKAQMARTLDILEQVAAIHRIKKGQTEVIAVTPEGAFRGNIENHGKTVERFRLDMIEASNLRV